MIENRQSALPVHFVGDTHVLPLANLVFHHPRAERTFRTVTKVCDDITSRELYDDKTDTLDPRLVAGMKSADLLLPDGTPTHFGQGTEHLARNFAQGEPMLTPLLAISAGSLDASDVLRQLGDFDFRLPAEAPDYGLDSTKQEVPCEVVEAAIAALVAPYTSGAKKLVTMGFWGVATLSLPPPTTDDDAFERINGFRTSCSLRYKVYWLFNRALRSGCARGAWTPFVDIWPEVTARGLLKPEYRLDDGHLNREAAWITLDKVVDAGIDIGLKANAAMYALALKYAEPSPKQSNPRYQSLRAEFKQRSFVVVKSDISAFAPILAKLSFDRPQSNQHMTFDWCGRSYQFAGTDPYPHLRSVDVPFEGLKALYSVFYEQPEVCEAIQAVCGSDFIVYKAQLRKTLVTGPQPADDDWHRDGCPPGVMRGILYLTDVDADSAPLQFLVETEKGEVTGIEQILGPAGTLTIFDAQRRHRGSKPKARERIALDLVFGPRIPSIPRMVIRSDTNVYPGDPFHFSLSNACVYPDLGVDKIVAQPATGVSNVLAWVEPRA